MAGEIETYIRQAALARGIDPDTAVRVAMSEGGLSNPVRQSDVVKNGRREQSFGPFQMLMDKGGLGDQALRHGIDPRDPNQWKQTVDFALDHAARHGWGSWYGANAVGIGNMQGIGKNAKPAGVTLTSTRMPGQTGTEYLAAKASMPEPASSATPAPVGATPAPTAAEPTLLEKLLGPDGKGLDKMAGAFGGGAGADDGSGDGLNTITPPSWSSTSGGGGDSGAAAQLLTQLISERKKRYGMSLDGAA